MSGAAVMPKVNLDKIPQELKDLPRWVVWRWENRNGKPTKPPYRPDGKGLASSTDPETWGTFHAAFQACRTGEYDGIGLVLSPADRLVGIDLDHCHNLETGEIDQWAQEYARTLNSYTERSVSGTGLHVLVFGSVPEGGNKKRIQGAQSEAAVEMYSHGRYLTMTGAHLEGTPTTVQERDPELKALHAEIFPPVLPPMRVQHNAQPLDMDDAELVTRAKAATNGAHFSRLWEGDTSAHGGDDSAADLALCNLLAFWTGRDAGRIDRLFKMSGLYRQKWDRPDYRQRTIETAIVGCTEVYTPARALLSNGHSSRAIPTAPMPLAGPDLTATTYPLSEAGNAEFFAHLFGDRVQHDHKRGRDLLWAGDWWAEDQDGELMRLALVATRTRRQLAANIADPDVSKKAFGWAIGSESRARLVNSIALARSLPPITDTGAGWDADPGLLGVANGVVEFRTGELRPGRREDRITMHTGTPYDPDAGCPRWLAFLGEVFKGDADLIDYIQRAVGYSLTGDASEQCLFLCYGTGSNGKGVFMGALRYVWGAFAYDAPFSTFELNARAAIPNDLAALAERRLVTASETNETTRLNEARIKALTGQDPVTARFLHAEFFTFQPVAKFWFAVNHKPKVGDDSRGFWRRVRLIPFTQCFEGDSIDKHLDAKLRAEAPGILAWAVRGALEWQRRGLEPPKVVATATEEYREESDPLAGFLAEVCVIAASCTAKAATLYKAYGDWAEAQGLRDRERLSSTALGRRMAERFDKSRTRGGLVYSGVGLLEDNPAACVGLGEKNPTQTSLLAINLPRGKKPGIPYTTLHTLHAEEPVTPTDGMVYHDGDCPALDGGACNCEPLVVA